MVEWVEKNYGKTSKCNLCGEWDSTEHVFDCMGNVNTKRVTVKDLENGEKMKDIVDLFKSAEEKRRGVLINDIMTNFEVLQREGTI